MKVSVFIVYPDFVFIEITWKCNFYYFISVSCHPSKSLIQILNKIETFKFCNESLVIIEVSIVNVNCSGK